jgi:hypothetical protein
LFRSRRRHPPRQSELFSAPRDRRCATRPGAAAET